MRLINCTTSKLEEFLGGDIPPYAILSHTWCGEEVSLIELNANQDAVRDKEGFKKIEFICNQALLDGLQFAWVDTCCIDKTSSAELSEAINSMFKLYENSDRCYAYLSDVPDKPLEKSRWFSRGWTLQELIAPNEVYFYDRNWTYLGPRSLHAALISETTGIDRLVLESYNQDLIHGFCIAKRMSWASKRQTTRLEDMAYCLLGIFDVNMPLLYGEGEKAFARLQEEIIKISADDSILAWGRNRSSAMISGATPSTTRCDTLLFKGPRTFVLASAPADFLDCNDMERGTRPTFPFTMTNLGFQIELPLMPVFRSSDAHDTSPWYWIGLLSCYLRNEPGFLGIMLAPTKAAEQMARITYEDENRVKTPTILVSPRLAAQAVPSKLTILHYEGFWDASSAHPMVWTVVLNPSSGFESTGYYVLYASKEIRLGTAGTTTTVVDSQTTWFPATRVLRVLSLFPDDFLIFNFISRRRSEDNGFTIIVQDVDSVVRKGMAYPVAASCMSDRFLEDPVRELPEKVENLSFEDDDGREFGITVKVTKKDISHMRIVEIDIDVISTACEETHGGTEAVLTYEQLSRMHLQ